MDESEPVEPAPEPEAAEAPVVPVRPAISGRHEATLAAIFDRPTRANVRWRDVEALLLALGATIKQGSGSRVRAELGGRFFNIHAPHPRPELKRYAVEGVRDFLTDQGIMP